MVTQEDIRYVSMLFVKNKKSFPPCVIMVPHAYFTLLLKVECLTFFLVVEVQIVLPHTPF